MKGDRVVAIVLMVVVGGILAWPWVRGALDRHPAATRDIAVVTSQAERAARDPDAAHMTLPAPPPDAHRATVAHVSDGDSLVLDAMTVAGRTRDGVRARLLRIDAPELGRDGRSADCGAVPAHQRLAELLPVGSTVTWSHDREQRDRYGRDLVHVWTVDGTWINGQLLAEGLATVVTFAPNDGFDDAVRAIEEVASNRAVGNWGNC